MPSPPTPRQTHPNRNTRVPLPGAIFVARPLPFLLFDDESALAGDDEEVLLGVLAVVEAGGRSGLQDSKVDADLREPCLALEAATGSEARAAHPGSVRGVQHEPADASSNRAAGCAFQTRLVHHVAPPHLDPAICNEPLLSGH